MAPKTQTVTLSEPLKVGEEEITSITLRKPSAGELRGINLVDVLQMNVDAMTRIIPRISLSYLDESALARMPADDFAELAGTVALFFNRDASRT